MFKINERIKYLRTEKNLTQKKMAKIIGVKEVSYQRYEYGHSIPNLIKLVFLADYFDVSLDYLVGRSDSPERK
ncbi:MAG: helix-turn-helix domain-containing protein [Oscillospiraceae bacterium]|nr:helix-turn-helix domain-containing protein [Oscillospiraceae bacterium]